MKVLKWLAIALLVLVALVAAAVAFAPALFGDRIRAAVDAELEHYVAADVTYGDVGLSLLRDFPKLTFEVENVVVEGQGAFDSIRLAQLGELAVSVDFWSAIGEGPIGIHAIELVAPRLHVVTMPDGTTNTDIVRNLQEAGDATAESESVEVSLERYAISDGELIYDDRAAGLYAHATGLHHSGSGDFTATTFDLDTETAIDALDVVSAGVRYLRRASLRYDADLLVDTEAGTVTLADNDLTLNELHVSANGNVGIPGEDGSIPVDLTLVAPQQDFRALWSVVPASFTTELDGLRTSGDFALNGTIKGTYVPEPQQLPAFAFDLEVDGGSVQYPELPQALTAINVAAGVRSSGRDLDDLLLDVSSFAFRLGANPFTGKLRVRNGSDPSFDLAAKGTLNLAELASALPIEGVRELAGVVDLDVEAAGTAEGANTDLRSVESRGIARVSDLVYEADGLPKVSVARGTARFSGSEIDLEDVAVRAGRSDFTLAGKLVDPFAVATETGTLGGRLSVNGNRLDANEWLSEPASTSTDASGVPAETARPFDRFDLDYDAAFEEVNYDVYDLRDVALAGSVSPEELRITRGDASLEGSRLALTGKLNNLYGFSFDGEELTGDLALRADRLDLLKLAEIGTDPNADPAAAPTTGYVELPADMTVRVVAAVEELVYDDITVSDVSGVIALANQAAVVENGRGKALGGSVAIDGGYQYRGEATPPTFDLKYDIQGASFKQAFEKLNTVQQLAPIAKFLEGTFNTNMVMSSSLGPDMLPRLQDLNADGFIATLNATLNDFTPLRKAADLLNVKELRTLDLKNTKNWFTIQDGTVEVRPFDVKWNDIDATIGGKHGLDQAMDYEIVALVPRKLIGNNALGAAANTGLDFLSGQASKLGLNLDVGEFVRVRIGITGSIDDPKVGVKLLGTESDGTAEDAATAAIKDLAQQARDSIERVAQAKLDAARAEVETKARAAADSVRNAAEQRARAAADEARAKAKAEADRLAQKAAAEAKARAADEAKRAAEDAAKKAGDDAADKAKDALKGIFGKKKPDDG